MHGRASQEKREEGRKEEEKKEELLVMANGRCCVPHCRHGVPARRAGANSHDGCAGTLLQHHKSCCAGTIRALGSW